MVTASVVSTGDGCSYDPSCGAVPSGMVCVPAGSFEMGSETGYDDEKPVRQVCMPTYYIDETERPMPSLKQGTHCAAQVAGSRRPAKPP
jgi:hypothetical protein